MSRAVIDTNVLVSAVILPASAVGVIVHLIRHGRFTPLYCQETLEELARVLARPRLRVKYHLQEQNIRTVIDLVLLRGTAVELTERVAVCRDPKDDVFLSLALAGSADVVVSGDNDLLSLHPFHGIPIVTPAEFVRRMTEAPKGE